MRKTPKVSLNFGVRGRLLISFLAICMFALIAAGSGVVSLSQLGSAFHRITQERVPQALSWVELSRLAERVVRAAPALLAVTREKARAEVSSDIAMLARQLEPLLQQSRTYVTPKQEEAAREVAELIGNLNANLVSLDELVKKRLFIVDRRDKLVRQLLQATKVAIRILAPGTRILESQIAEWKRNNEFGNYNESETAKLAGSIVNLTSQQRGSALVDAVQNTLLQITTADSAENIDLLIFPLKRSLEELSEIAEILPERVKRRMVKQISIIENLAFGRNSLAQNRKEELAVITEAEELLAVNVRVSSFVTNRINFLVNGAKTEIVNAQMHAAAVQSLSTKLLVAVVAMSLTSSILIVWLYVGRNLIARLTALSSSMLAIAGGNLRAPLPSPRGNDEISRMAEALIVLRDNSVELEESNLREIEMARRRLVDAIENSSEGFAFYDSDAKLVICNSQYKNLLCSDASLSIEPGMALGAILRAAAGDYERAMDGGIDEWVEAQIRSHTHPGEPRLQERDDGRWLLITERKTGDGGIVVIYSDITDMKLREEELARKSNALEQLSNQLAKYLSPQIYESIFSGRQQVKLASSRKRLTVFFSDIADFTETTDRLQSEDLTQLLNHYLTEMSQIALGHGATIDKYVGDAILIFFGDPESKGVKQDAIACVTMALAMRRRLEELREVWMESGIEHPLRCRIGINTGLCTVGNFGSEDRMDYTIIGGDVNLAARLESACPPGEILISYETHAHVKDVIRCEEHGHIQVKGIPYPVTTYRVIDLHQNIKDDIQPIQSRLPHLYLDVELSRMTEKERRAAASVLKHAVEKLSESFTGADRE